MPRGRPRRTDNPQPVSLRLHPDAHAILTRLARNKGKSRSLVATALLERAGSRFAGDLPVVNVKGITTALWLSSVALENLKRGAADNDSTLSAELTRYIFGAVQ
jgi:hypothetical protein